MDPGKENCTVRKLEDHFNESILSESKHSALVVNQVAAK